jgi:hypothetical protein
LFSRQASRNVRTGAASRNSTSVAQAAADYPLCLRRDFGSIRQLELGQKMIRCISELTVCAIIYVIFPPIEILAGQGGWFFMVPPLATGSFEVETSVPLVRWNILERFDSMEDCEQEISHIIGSVHDQSWLAEREKEYRDLGPGTPLRPGASALAKKTYEAAKCVSADDPGLKR